MERKASCLNYLSAKTSCILYLPGHAGQMASPFLDYIIQDLLHTVRDSPLEHKISGKTLYPQVTAGYALMEDTGIPLLEQYDLASRKAILAAKASSQRGLRMAQFSYDLLQEELLALDLLRDKNRREELEGIQAFVEQEGYLMLDPRLVRLFRKDLGPGGELREYYDRLRVLDIFTSLSPDREYAENVRRKTARVFEFLATGDTFPPNDMQHLLARDTRNPLLVTRGEFVRAMMESDSSWYLIGIDFKEFDLSNRRSMEKSSQVLIGKTEEEQDRLLLDVQKDVDRKIMDAQDNLIADLASGLGIAQEGRMLGLREGDELFLGIRVSYTGSAGRKIARVLEESRDMLVEGFHQDYRAAFTVFHPNETKSYLPGSGMVWGSPLVNALERIDDGLKQAKLLEQQGIDKVLYLEHTPYSAYRKKDESISRDRMVDNLVWISASLNSETESAYLWRKVAAYIIEGRLYSSDKYRGLLRQAVMKVTPARPLPHVIRGSAVMQLVFAGCYDQLDEEGIRRVGRRELNTVSYEMTNEEIGRMYRVVGAEIESLQSDPDIRFIDIAPLYMRAGDQRFHIFPKVI